MPRAQGALGSQGPARLDELVLGSAGRSQGPVRPDELVYGCPLYTSDAADEEDSVDLGGRRIIKKNSHP